MNDTKITVIGNISEPELRHTSSGVPVVSFQLAHTTRILDKAQNTWVDGTTSWYTVSAFRALADHAFESLKKGDRVVVHGRFTLRAWENGSGVRGMAAEIDADSIGHDLRWGTTTFVKQGDKAPTQAASAAEAWHVADGAPAPSEPRDDADVVEPEGELVLAGADGTPF